MAEARPGALRPAVWEAALRKHLAAPPTPPDAEAATTWVALWHAIQAAGQQQPGVPPLEVFVTRRARQSARAQDSVNQD